LPALPPSAARHANLNAQRAGYRNSSTHLADLADRSVETTPGKSGWHGHVFVAM